MKNNKVLLLVVCVCKFLTMFVNVFIAFQHCLLAALPKIRQVAASSNGLQPAGRGCYHLVLVWMFFVALNETTVPRNRNILL